MVGEGMAGSLYWQDFISLVKEIGFSTPYLVAASHIVVHNCQLLKKAGNFVFLYQQVLLCNTLFPPPSLLTG